MREQELAETLLKTHLEVVVPFYIAEIKERGGLTERDIAWLHKTSGELSEHSDDILFRSKRKGETARLVSVLAKSLAMLSFLPGGVMFLGLLWETKGEMQDERC